MLLFLKEAAQPAAQNRHSDPFEGTGLGCSAVYSQSLIGIYSTLVWLSLLRTAGIRENIPSPVHAALLQALALWV